MSQQRQDNSDIVLEVRNIVKTFPGIRALDRVGFELKKGEVHALVGENGAGKSTLMHVLGGVYQPDSGQIYLDGKAVTFLSPHSAARCGIGVVFQELSLAENLSVAENIFAHRQPTSLLNIIDRRRLYAQTADILNLFELQINPATIVKNLPVAEKQVVEILKTISQDPRVLILDEPTSSLTATEVEHLFKIIKKLRGRGLSFIYVSHFLREIFEIADRVTILRDGKFVDTCPLSGVTEQDIVRKMVGREIVDMYGCRTIEFGAECFRLENACRSNLFCDISFSVHRGEIVGIAGLSGAGRTELARAIFGAEPLDTGRMFLNDQPVRLRSVRQAIDSRIGYLTEDRKQQGLFLDAPIRANCVAPSLNCFTNRFGLINDGAITNFAEASRVNLNIVCPNVFQKVSNLSGGNQQKVLLSMWIGIQPLLLIVDEPTRGVDVGARSEIYHLLRKLAAGGTGIIMISSDLPEVLGLSDRILVMRNGRLVGEFDRSGATEENIIACASGVHLSGKPKLN